MGRTIAIDGPSGAGKSTVAKMLAEMLDFKYLDTGALYRAVAIGLINAGIKPDSSDEEITTALTTLSVSFRDGKALLDGRDVSGEIRTTEIGHYSSVFSARRPVREYLFPVQRDAAGHYDIVAEGRDTTTVVFPRAWKKFYLDASVEARAGRRYEQLMRNGVPVDMTIAMEDIVERDKRDSSRDLAPLRVAPDAVYIDTSDMAVDAVVRAILEEMK